MVCVITDRKSPNFGERRGGNPVDMLVLHYTDAPDCETAFRWLCDPQREVSAHYLIDEDGTVFQLVDESKRAWHAGASFWRGETDINSRSIGIEIQNPGHGNGYRPFPEPQMQAVIDLCRDITGRYAIPARNILAHSDIAPGRKIDPGELFDWPRLAAAGIGCFPDIADGSSDADIGETLAAIGYDPQAEQAVAAFQRRYRPSAIDNHADAETRALADALLQQLAGTST
ncbi:MAG: N-acetylmuramoyl-L-alanine amidase [Alphaproteobacteria bacterium]